MSQEWWLTAVIPSVLAETGWSHQPDQHGETLFSLKIQKLTRGVVAFTNISTEERETQEERRLPVVKQGFLQHFCSFFFLTLTS